MISSPLIDARSLATLLEERRTLVLDCRFDLNAPEAGRTAFRAAHIPTACHLDLNTDLAAPVTARSGRHPLPAAGTLVRKLGALGLGDARTVVVYDAANGSIAARAWWLLRRLGVPHVAVLDGGFDAWVEMGGQVRGAGHPDDDPTFPDRDAFDRPGGPDPDPGAVDPYHRAVVSTAELQAALHDPALLLIDARTPERFAGSVEPLDAVAGHVPGAHNHPFVQNLAADGRFLPAAELRRRWLERLDGATPREVVMMCGSGVTACHNLLALEVAGLPGARLYAGSWSEWIRDPRRPVARGSGR